MTVLYNLEQLAKVTEVSVGPDMNMTVKCIRKTSFTMTPRLIINKLIKKAKKTGQLALKV